ncbi:MAG: AAA family ATPase [Candidatus Bathyarchaeia archaeon]
MGRVRFPLNLSGLNAAGYLFLTGNSSYRWISVERGSVKVKVKRRVKGEVKTVLALAGMPGSGKGVFSEAASSLGVPVYVCGDVVRDEAVKMGLPVNRVSMRRLMFELRSLEGSAAVVKRLMPKLGGEQSRIMVVEGVRSLSEVEELRKVFHVLVCAVHASPDVRFKRLASRGRADDPRSVEEFKSRDMDELKLGLGDVIALADRVFINEGGLEEFKGEVKRFLEGFQRLGVHGDR